MTRHVHVSKATQRRFEEVIAADRKFFERFPDRSFRLRQLSGVKNQIGIATQTLSLMFPGDRTYKLIKNLKPRGRLSGYFKAPANYPTDLPDVALAGLWDALANLYPEMVLAEAALSDPEVLD